MGEREELIARLRARVSVETACGNRTENPSNHVRLMHEAADLLESLGTNGDGMREALTACRAKFAEYVELHRAKTQGALSLYVRKQVDAKVTRNQEMVDLCDRALSTSTAVREVTEGEE